MAKIKRRTLTLMLVAVLLAVVLGVLSAPMLAERRKAAQDKAILTHLHQIVATAFCVMLDKGVTKIGYTQLAAEKFIRPPFTSVAGESYDGIVIYAETTREISVIKANGEKIIYKLRRLVSPFPIETQLRLYA